MVMNDGLTFTITPIAHTNALAGPKGRGVGGRGVAVNWGNSIMPEDRQRQLCLVNVCPRYL